MASGSWQPRKGAPNVSMGKREWRTPSPQFASVWPQGRAGAFCFFVAFMLKYWPDNSPVKNLCRFLPLVYLLGLPALFAGRISAQTLLYQSQPDFPDFVTGNLAGQDGWQSTLSDSNAAQIVAYTGGQLL